MESLLIIMLSFAAAVVPALIFFVLILWIDRYEKEPLPLVLAVFLWGSFFSIIGALILEIIFDYPVRFFFTPDSLVANLLSAGLIAPVVEEGIKGVGLLAVFFVLRREFDNVLDGIVYGSIVGLGFAMTENFFYFLGQETLGSLAVLVTLRVILGGLGHSLYTSLTGAALGFVAHRYSLWEKIIIVPLGFLGAVAAHSLWNLLAILSASSGQILLYFLGVVGEWTGVLILLIVAIAVGYYERKHINQQLPKYLGSEIVTKEELALLTSYVRRQIAILQVLFSRGLSYAWNFRKLMQSQIELAFREYQVGRAPSGSPMREQIERDITRIKQRIGMVRRVMV